MPKIIQVHDIFILEQILFTLFSFFVVLYAILRFYYEFIWILFTFELILTYQDHQSMDALEPYGKKFSGLAQEQPFIEEDLLRIDPYF